MSKICATKALMAKMGEDYRHHPLYIIKYFFRNVSSAVSEDENVLQEFVNSGVIELWENFVSQQSSNVEFKEFTSSQFELFNFEFTSFFE